MKKLILYLMMSGFCFASSSKAAPLIHTVVGTGAAELGPMQGPARTFRISNPFGVEVGPDGALYMTEVGHHRLLRLDFNSGQVDTVAGTGMKGYAGDGGPASKALLHEPYEVRFDQVGNIYFVEMMNHIIRRVDAKTKVISTIAGTGKKGFSGDGGPALKATFNRPHSICLDEKRHHLYVADIGNHRIRRIDLKTGLIETYAGTGEKKRPKEGKPIRGKPIIGPRALYLTADTLWVALREGHSVWKIDLNNDTIHLVAGTGKKGYSGDGGEARQATFNGPKGIAVDAQENIYVVDTENQAIRKIDGGTGMISSLAGYGPAGKGFNGDKVEAAQAKMGRPHGICVAPDGTVYVGDTLNHRVRSIR